MDLQSQGVRIGYARVSTHEQNLDLQLDALRKAHCTEIYQEKMSGKSAKRPELEYMLKALRARDTLVVWRLDRLGRNASDLIQISTVLAERGINLESLTEQMDTSTAMGKLWFNHCAIMAQFERDVMRERTMAGLASARARGRKGGRKPALTPDQVREVDALLADPRFTVVDVAKRYGVSRATIYNRHRARSSVGGKDVESS
ncbi:recombinase family protein (plasmid) [Pseudomonas viciae]|uniref:Recombinase family protein n=1 Tax=Pseudomonas viciae TaxID=2505979 RepID=A0ABY8PMW3_9PSED|nr:recombinase family protein [Pseudomonas viciae]WGO96461.1 recombinase family protein [Pseudomonas viciae]